MENVFRVYIAWYKREKVAGRIRDSCANPLWTPQVLMLWGYVNTEAIAFWCWLKYINK